MYHHFRICLAQTLSLRCRPFGIAILWIMAILSYADADRMFHMSITLANAFYMTPSMTGVKNEVVACSMLANRYWWISRSNLAGERGTVCVDGCCCEWQYCLHSCCWTLHWDLGFWRTCSSRSSMFFLAGGFPSFRRWKLRRRGATEVKSDERHA